MKTILARASEVTWSPGSPIYGPGSVYRGAELVHLKVLSDRREVGGGIAYLVKFSPPKGRLIKIIAVARSEEHVYILEGEYCNRAGAPLRFPGDYAMNLTGQPHSAFIGTEVVSLVVYAGEPDEVRTFEVIERDACDPSPKTLEPP